jgi:GlcNAc-P-P-Und epimerase
VCVSLDRAGTSPCDILDLNCVREKLAGCSAIYHLAAEHRDNVTPTTRYYDVNVQGTKNLLQAADLHGIKRVIFTSSFAVYGLDQGEANEDSPTLPFNDYGKSKLEAEGVLKDWAQKDPARILTIIRPVVVFGEGNRGNVHTLMDQIAKNRFVMVGNGKNAKSMAYVGNVAAFLLFCLLQNTPLEVFNYADKPDLSVATLVNILYDKLNKAKPPLTVPYPLGLAGGYGFDLIAKITKKSFPISAVRVEKFCANTLCNADRARETGFVPPFGIDDGLARMLEFDFQASKTAA